MLPEIAVVVPTYWTRIGAAFRPGDAVYDHPTPLDQDGTLGRLLESLARLDTSRFYLLVVVAVSGSDVEAAARRKVETIVGSVPQLRSIVFAGAEGATMVARLDDLRDVTNAMLGLQTYSRVRNLHLAIPFVLGSEVIIALDDDEVVTDERFLDRATEGLGSTLDGRRVDGVSGYYLQDRSGRILLSVPPGSERAANMFDRKAAIMNEGTIKLESNPGRLVETPFCFGGNMVFSRDLASSIFFDPSITRGEDIDYLINSRLDGKWFFMNKDLRVLHLPPSGASYEDVSYHKVIQDVLRFTYEREKLKSWNSIGAVREVTVQELSPYPGAFLDDELERDATEVIERIFHQVSLDQKRALGLGESSESFMERAHERARTGAQNFSAFREGWLSLMGGLSRASALKSDLMRLVSDASTAGGLS